MYKISTRGQYALMTMEALAEETDSSKYIPLKTLSHRQNLSVKYLEQILTLLSKAKLVDALRGNNGGYRLVKNKSEYTVGEILRAMEGDLGPRSEGSGIPVKTTGTEKFWTDFEEVINNYVDSITLGDIARNSSEGNNYLYYI